MNKYIRKGWKLFAINIQDVEAKGEQQIENFMVLIDFKYVYPQEISILPPKQDLDFSIELTPGSVSASKSPHHMSAP